MTRQTRSTIITVLLFITGIIAYSLPAAFLGARGIATAAPALPYDRAVKYLQSSGTQYIDTGIKPTATISSYIDYELGADKSSTQWLFGSRTTGYSTASHAVLFYNPGGAYFSVRADWVYGGSVSVANWVDYGFYNGISKRSIITATPTDFTVADYDGAESHTVSTGTKSGSDNNMMLFTIKDNSGISAAGFKGKVYSHKLTDSGVPVRDFIPVIDKQGRPCMWDKITNTPFYNHRTGEFGWEEMDGTIVNPR